MDQVKQGKHQSSFTRCNKKRAHQQQFLFTASLQECLPFYLVSIKLWLSELQTLPTPLCLQGFPLGTDMAVPALPSSPPDLQARLQTGQCPTATLRASCESHGGPQNEVSPPSRAVSQPAVPCAPPEEPLQPAVSPWLQGQGARRQIQPSTENLDIGSGFKREREVQMGMW